MSEKLRQRTIAKEIAIKVSYKLAFLALAIILVGGCSDDEKDSSKKSKQPPDATHSALLETTDTTNTTNTTNTVESSDRSPEVKKAIHIVESGDTLSGLANQYGISLAELLNLNPQKTSNPDVLSIGEEIVVAVHSLPPVESAEQSQSLQEAPAEEVSGSVGGTGEVETEDDVAETTPAYDATYEAFDDLLVNFDLALFVANMDWVKAVGGQAFVDKVDEQGAFAVPLIGSPDGFDYVQALADQFGFHSPQ